MACVKRAQTCQWLINDDRVPLISICKFINMTWSKRTNICTKPWLQVNLKCDLQSNYQAQNIIF